MWTPAQMREAAMRNRRELGLTEQDSVELPGNGEPFWKLTLCDLTDQQLIDIMEKVREVRS